MSFFFYYVFKNKIKHPDESTTHAVTALAAEMTKPGGCNEFLLEQG